MNECFRFIKQYFVNLQVNKDLPNVDFRIHWANENDEYIFFSGYVFSNKNIIIPIGGSVDIFLFNKKSKIVNTIELKSVNFENTVEVELPEEIAVPEDYNTYGMF